MRWMYWLTTDERRQLRDRIKNTINYELSKNRWGAVAPGSLDRIKHFYITDYRALTLAIGVIRYTQQAFMMKTSNSRKELGRLSAYQAATFIIPRTLLRLWSNYDNIPSNYMYPNDVTDAGLRFWNGAVKKVIDDGYDFGPLMG